MSLSKINCFIFVCFISVFSFCNASGSVPFNVAGDYSQNTGHWRIQTSLYTVHYNPEPWHNNHQKLLNIEYIRADNWIAGFAIFRNSFHQPAQYAYIGYDWPLWYNNDWQIYTSVSAGFLHGYKGEYKNKIPLNRYGIAPAILPSLGVMNKNGFFIKANLFATAGVMVTAGYHF